MPFNQVPAAAVSAEGGNFTGERRRFFNQCGTNHYCGSLQFQDSKHALRTVPIFHDDCLENNPETYGLLKALRKALKEPPAFYESYQLNGTQWVARSIHQNVNGYLPYTRGERADRPSVSAPAIRDTARLFGQLPHNQAMVVAATKGEFLEYTCGDGMHVECRLIVDYRFGFIYMTFGHYDKHSFALLVRSDAELRFELQPILPTLGATFVV
jgi:hypothetical protein